MSKKYKPSEELGSPLERKHYNAGRKFFDFMKMLEKVDSNLAKKASMKVEVIKKKYPELMNHLNNELSNYDESIPEELEDKLKLKEYINQFTEERYLYIIDLAEKDYKDNYGVSEVRTEWR